MRLSKSIKLTVLGLVAAALVGCAKDAERKEKTSNPNFKYEILFEADGCKFGRFKDAGKYIYTVVCPNGPSRAEYYRSTGKTTVREQSVTNTID